MPVYCDECEKALNPNDETIYTPNGGALCEKHRQDPPTFHLGSRRTKVKNLPRYTVVRLHDDRIGYLDSFCEPQKVVILAPDPYETVDDDLIVSVLITPCCLATRFVHAARDASQ